MSSENVDVLCRRKGGSPNESLLLRPLVFALKSRALLIGSFCIVGFPH